MNPYREPQKPTNSRLREFFVNRVTRPTVVLAAILVAGIALAAATPSLRVNGIKFADGSNTYSAVYNVKAPDFGCKGDGSTDDSACIQAAVTAAKAATNATVYVPPGNYKINSTITFNTINGMQFNGAGTQATTFTWGGGASSVMFDLQGVSYSHFRGFTMIGDAGGAGGTQTAIKYNGILGTTVSTKNVFEDIMLASGFNYGIRIGQVAYQCDQTDYRNVMIYHTTTAGVSIEDANAVIHNFYSCQFQYNNIGITSNNAGTGGSFNLYGTGFILNTGVDIQTYPGSRGYDFSGVWSEGGSVFLQMPQTSGGSTVTLTECSVNGSSLNGTHIRVGSGALNIVGGKYTATPNTFTIGVGSTNGNISNITATGTTFKDGNPFTGANISTLASIHQFGVKYADVGGETADIIGPSRVFTDTAGKDLVLWSGAPGAVSASAGQNPGDLKLFGTPGANGTAGLAAGRGADIYVVASAAGTNGGAGGNRGGNIYMEPGALSGAGATGLIQFLDTGGVTRETLNPSGTTMFFPADTNTRALGGTSNYFSNIFASRQTALGQAIAAATSITINPASGSKVRVNLSGTAITSITYTAGNDGERSTVCVAEDATGTRTIPSSWTNVRFATPGTYTATTTASKIDCINFVYDSTATAWLETGRAMGL